MSATGARHTCSSVQVSRTASVIEPRPPATAKPCLGPEIPAASHLLDVDHKRRLSLFTGSTTDDWLNRASIYSKFALLYRSSFHQPETAIRYHYCEIAATMRLLADEEYRVYRSAKCSGAFMNILATTVQDLHDVPRAQQTLDWAAAMIPSFPSEPYYRDSILRLGLQPPRTETVGVPPATFPRN